MPEKTRRRLPSPYNARESAGCLWRNVFGPSRRNPAGVEFLPRDAVLNEIAPRRRVAFLGDVMGLRGRRLEISLELAEFVRDCDALVGNFEGTLTTARRRLPYDQTHDEKIVAGLRDLFPPAKTFLSVANNHAGDFARDVRAASMATLRDAGFTVFGTADEPGVLVAPELFVVAATQWNNRDCPEAAQWDAFAAAALPLGALCAAFPHWGYELECWPRRETVAAGRRLLEKFAAVVGSHSHTPQAVAAAPAVAGAPARLVAYSLGDFCFFGPRFAPYSFGEVVKIEVGPTPAGGLAVGRVQWQFVQSVAASEDVLRVELRDSIPFFESGIP